MTRLLLTADAVGGVWQYATDLAGALVEHGVAPILATLGPRADAKMREALPGGVELIETDLPLDWLAGSAREIAEASHAIARLADRHRADIIQLNTPALAAERMFDQPVVTVAHSCVGTWWQAVKGGSIAPDLAWRADLTGAGLRAADRVVAPSGAFAAMLQNCYDLPQAPAVVRNGRRAAALREAPRQDFAFTAGRLWDAGKNIGVLDSAAASMSIPLKTAGPLAGPNGSAILLGHAQSLGSLDDGGIARTLAAQPVFVSSALYEPFGLAVLEAAQAGCALVLSDIPTFRELWEGAARFVYPHDATGFARAVDEIVADPALRTQLGDAARARAADYSVTRMTAGMLALYRALPATALELVAA